MIQEPSAPASVAPRPLEPPNGATLPESAGAENGAQPLGYGFSVVIPAVNEQGAVGKVVRDVAAVMRGIGKPYEIIVVDDGSTDDTAAEAREAGATVLQHPQNAGYGAGLKTGILHARFDRVIITDADQTYPIDRIPDLVADADRFDMVVGARRGKHYRQSWRKSFSRLMLGTLCQWVTGTPIPDVNSGFRVFRTALATQYFHVISQGFSFTTTITLAALSNGYFVKYIPIEYHQRAGRSRVKIVRDALRTLQIVFQAVVYYNPIKCFLGFSMLSLLLAILSWILFALIRVSAVGVMAALFSISVVHFIAIGLLADLIRVRHVPRAPTLTSQVTVSRWKE